MPTPDGQPNSRTKRKKFISCKNLCTDPTLFFFQWLKTSSFQNFLDLHKVLCWEDAEVCFTVTAQWRGIWRPCHLTQCTLWRQDGQLRPSMAAYLSAFPSAITLSLFPLSLSLSRTMAAAGFPFPVGVVWDPHHCAPSPGNRSRLSVYISTDVYNPSIAQPHSCACLRVRKNFPFPKTNASRNEAHFLRVKWDYGIPLLCRGVGPYRSLVRSHATHWLRTVRAGRRRQHLQVLRHGSGWLCGVPAKHVAPTYVTSIVSWERFGNNSRWKTEEKVEKVGHAFFLQVRPILCPTLLLSLSTIVRLTSSTCPSCSASWFF